MRLSRTTTSIHRDEREREEKEQKREKFGIKRKEVIQKNATEQLN